MSVSNEFVVPHSFDHGATVLLTYLFKVVLAHYNVSFGRHDELQKPIPDIVKRALDQAPVHTVTAVGCEAHWHCVGIVLDLLWR